MGRWDRRREATPPRAPARRRPIRRPIPGPIDDHSRDSCSRSPCHADVESVENWTGPVTCNNKACYGLSVSPPDTFSTPRARALVLLGPTVPDISSKTDELPLLERNVERNWANGLEARSYPVIPRPIVPGAEAHGYRHEMRKFSTGLSGLCPVVHTISTTSGVIVCCLLTFHLFD